MAVHLLGSYATIEAAWPYMIKQGYGRIVNTTSVSGLYGNFGQANYSTAKAGIIGLSQAYARAGAAHNIAVNTIAPAAGTNMSQSVMSKEMALSMKAQFNAPFVVALCSSLITPVPTGLIFETGLGWGANTILRRSHSYDFHLIESISPEHVLDAWTQSGRLGRDDNSTMSPKL
ncbi:hypothetical protein BJY01DRAFT_224385 [Aspergillus pseudoustus]|uniref:Uncharacterized protein n=1 Tax=Aspergillus pseudoustus TaxID=1810923 RepID=A0ABR4J287_9EURO